MNKSTILIGAFLALLLYAIVNGLFFPARSSSSGPAVSTVTLHAKSWNNGQVHVWKSLREVPGEPNAYVDVPDGTRCTRLDFQWHKLDSGDSAIYYYHVDCNGIAGYVERDQAR